MLQCRLASDQLAGLRRIVRHIRNVIPASRKRSWKNCTRIECLSSVKKKVSKIIPRAGLFEMIKRHMSAPGHHGPRLAKRHWAMLSETLQCRLSRAAAAIRCLLDAGGEVIGERVADGCEPGWIVRRRLRDLARPAGRRANSGLAVRAPPQGDAAYPDRARTGGASPARSRAAVATRSRESPSVVSYGGKTSGIAAGASCDSGSNPGFVLVWRVPVLEFSVNDMPLPPYRCA